MSMGIEPAMGSAGVGVGPLAPAPRGGASFAEALRGALPASGGGASSPRETAERFVSMALVEPVLAQLRETSRAAAPFGPSRHERQFASMLDAAVSREIVRSSGWGLVDRIERTMAARAAATREGRTDG